jgi:predicted ATP-dependent protease
MYLFKFIYLVIEKRLKLSLWSRDVYLNVVGGLRLSEPAADLAVAVTIVSSLVGMKIRAGICFIGEVGLAGEIRGIRGVELRIAEALKMGFTTVIIPKNKKISRSRIKDEQKVQSQVGAKGLGVVECETLFETLTIALEVDNFEEILGRLRSDRKKKPKDNRKVYNENSDRESKSYGWDNYLSKNGGRGDYEGIYSDSNSGTDINTDKDDHYGSEGFMDDE